MDIAEKRVYDDAAGRVRLAVATGSGLAIVGISGDAVGEFGLALRDSVRAIAPVGEGRLLVATADSVALVALADDGSIAAVDRSVPTGLGGASALSVAEGAAFAALDDGTLRRAPLDDLVSTTDGDAPASGDRWRTVGTVPPVRRADGPLLATAEGVYRATTDGLAHVGLEDVRDVAAAGPYAAAESGLYRLGPGWTAERGDATERVTAAVGAAGGEPEPAHAVQDDRLLERVDGAWVERSVPNSGPIADVAYAPAEHQPAATYAVAADGTVLVDAGDGWRSRSLGLPGVEGCTVVE